MASPLSSFLNELKRRRVFRVAAVYGGVAFVLFQIIDSIFEPLHIPEWTGSLIIILLLVGFPLAVGLAWVFDITPQGIVRTDRVSTDSVRKAKVQPGSGKPLTSNRVLIVVALLAVAFGIWGRWGGQDGSPGQIRSVAVLPLTNMMNDQDLDYFVDGMHEALIAQLSKIGALRVISRTSAMRYKQTDKTASQIARELDVDALVEGSVLLAGNRVRITAQLIGIAPERHLWSEDYERNMGDILLLHSDVARAIARQIEVVLSPVEEAGLAAAQPTVNPEAYKAYLQGHHIMLELQDFQSASPFFEKAIALDPGYAPPYADLAFASLLSADVDLSLGGNVVIDQQSAKAQKLIDQAISLDPQLPMAYIVLGIVRTSQARWREAGGVFRQAISIAPNSRLANVEYGWFLLRAGKVDQAVGYMELGLQLDPLSVHSYHSLAKALYFQRQYDQALEVISQGLKLDPGSILLNRTAASIYLWMGQYEEVIEMFDGWDQLPSYFKGLIHVARGQRGEALRLIEDLKALEPGEKLPSDYYVPIKIYAALGEVDRALDELEHVYTIEKQRLRLWDFGLTTLKVEPAYDPLRGHPRFQALVKDMYGE